MLRNGNRNWWQRATSRLSESRSQAGGRRWARWLRSRPRVEALESRYAPSVSMSIAGGVLTVTSDNSGNTITIDHNTATNVTTVNGLNFADAAFTSIRVNGGTGHDTDNLLATPAKTTVVNNNGPSTVNVGKNGSVQGILGLMSIENPPSLNAITIDDSADPATRVVTLDTYTPSGDSLFGRVSGLINGGVVIEYECPDTSAATIKTSHAFDTVNVLGTGNNTTLVGSLQETVNVGSAGSVQGIRGTLTVTNPPSFSRLTVDNSADTTRHVVTMNASGGLGSINGLAPSPIFYNLTDVNAVTVNGGPNNGASGVNSYTVLNTVNNPTNPLTTLNVGNAFAAPINVLATTGPLTVTSAGSSQTWTVGHVGSVQGIQGALNLNSTVNNAVFLDDSADAAARTVTINDTSITGLAPAAIAYHGLGTFIHAGNGNDTFTVSGNSGAGNSGTDLTLGSGFNHVNVRATTERLGISGGSFVTTVIGSQAPSSGFGGTVANIHGAVTVAEDGASSLLVVDDSGDTTARTVTVGAAPGFVISGLAPADIEFGSIDAGVVALDTGTGADTYTVTNSPPSLLQFSTGHGADTINVQRTGGPVDIGNNGHDTVNLGDPLVGTAAIQGNVSVGGNGAPAVNVNDQANPFASHVTLHFTGVVENVSGLGTPSSPFTLSYGTNGISGLTINGGSHGNTYNVQQDIGIPVTLHTGSGNDTINVGDAGNTLDGIHALLTVDGQAGFDTLNINDQGETTAHSYTIGTTSVVRSPGGPTINYFDIENLNVHPGKLLAAGPTNNVVDVLGTDANTAVEVDASGGTTVNVGNEAGTLDDLQGALNVVGEDGSVALNVNDQGSAGTQNYAVAADTVDRTGAATIAYVGVADLTLNAGAGGNQIDVQSLPVGTPATVNAGTGGDLIRMRGGPVNAPLTIHGRGNTRLGYVAYTTPVFVDVPTGQATDVKGGFSGISSITGGSDLNILVGDGNEDLNGVAGSRNLLISGGGNHTLTGGGVGDILIGATTAYDADANGELEAILAEFTSGAYADVVPHIIAGDTDLDPYPLNPSTVFDNGAQNTIIGHPVGGELNLYYVTDAESGLYDATPTETVIDVSGGPAPSTGGPARLTAAAAPSFAPAAAPGVPFPTPLALEPSAGPPATAPRSNVLAVDAVRQTAQPAGSHRPALATDLAGSDLWQPWPPSDGALD